MNSMVLIRFILVLGLGSHKQQQLLQACCYSMCVGWLAHQHLLWPQDGGPDHHHRYQSKPFFFDKNFVGYRFRPSGAGAIPAANSRHFIF
jgi:hypothetical protein